MRSRSDRHHFTLSLGAALLLALSSACGGKEQATEDVAAPVFDPAQGSYDEDILVSLESATDGASIFFTTDGTEPGPNSSEYSAPIEVAGDGTSVTIKAIATKEGMNDSAVVTATYTIEYDTDVPQTQAPVFSPEEGTYSEAVEVTLTTATEGAAIIFTIDGSTPAEGQGETYSAPILLAEDETEVTIKAIASKDGMLDSDVTEATYVIEWETVADPSISPESGTYHEPVEVELSSSTDGASIYYTMDGTEPSTDNGAIYVEPVSLDEHGAQVTFKAVAVKEGMRGSGVVEAEFSIHLPPVSPTVFSPVEDEIIRSPVVVEGQAAEGHTVQATLMAGDDILATSSVEADDGSYELTLDFEDRDGGTELVLEVLQSDGLLESAATIVNLVQESTYRLGGTVEQLSGEQTGTVHVWLYDDATDVLDPIAKLTFAPGEHEPFPPTGFEFKVLEGDYVLRAFRDSGGPRTNHGQLPPDGLPTLGADAQAVATAVSITDDDHLTSHLTLEQTYAAHYSNFHVRTVHTGYEAEPPHYEDEHGNWIPGEGLCGGYHMLMDVRGWGDIDVLGAPRAKLPGGSIVALLDDGGCGSEVADNRSSSYNWHPEDGHFSFGWTDPTEDDAGTYTLFYQRTDVDLLNIEQFELTEVVKLARNVPLAAPTGAEGSQDLTPTLTWDPVPGATGYSACIRDSRGWEANCYFTDEPSKAVPSDEPLLDKSTYCVSVTSSIKDEFGRDLALAHGVDSCFVTCVDAADCVTISGSISNRSGATGPYLIRSHSDEFGAHSTIVLPETAEQYQLTALRHDPEGRLEIELFVDVEDTGDPRVAERQGVRQRHHIEASSDVENVDFALWPTLAATSPEDGATGVGTQPVFTWTSYADTYLEVTGESFALQDWSYAVWIGSGDDDMPDIIWMLGSDVVAFDMADRPPHSLDLMHALTEGAASSLPDLSSADMWAWGLVLLACDYEDLECILAHLDAEMFITESPARTLATN